MLRDSVSAMEFSQPVCTITAVSKDLVRRPTRISYDLSLATLSHELGCLLADSGTIRREVIDQLRDALVCSYYVRCVSTQRFLADVSVNHSRTGAVKLLITRRTSQSSKLLRGTVRRTTACPGAATGLRSSPRSKRMTRPCASRTLLSSCLRGNAGSRCGNPGRPGRADVAPPRPFRRSQLCTLCWPALLRRPLAVRSRLGPT